MFIRKVTLICIISTVVLAGVVMADSISNINITTQQKLEPNQINQKQMDTSDIYTHFGKFSRISSPQTFKPSEIANSKRSINSDTKELILDYGTFVKD